jgi:prevent-host-death family protein
MKTVSMADVKANLSGCMKASEQAPVVITRNGKPAAVLIAVTDEDELERLLMAHSPRLQAILKAARDRIQAGEGIPEQQFWADLERSKENRKRKPTQRKPA